MKVLFRILVTSAFCWNIGASTVCWECTSLDDGWCTEHFVGKDLSPYTARVVNCTGGCMKMVALVDVNTKFYLRTCDVTDVVPGTCQTRSHVLGIPRSSVCVCPTDRCNRAPLQNERTNTLVKIFFGIIIWWTNKI